MGRLMFLAPSLLLAAGTTAAQDRPGAGLRLATVIETVSAGNASIRQQWEQLELSRGALREAEGPFDPTLRFTVTHGRDHNPLTLASQQTVGSPVITTDATTQQASLDKLTRWGMQVTPSVEVRRNANQTLTTEPVTNTGRVNLRLVQPLWRGRGSVAIAARADAASFEYDAARADYVHAVRKEVAGAVVAYWQYVAAQRSLAIVQESELRARTLAAETRQLVEKDEVPRAELTQLAANVAEKLTQRIRAEQELVIARSRLGLAMGLAADRVAALPPPEDTLPEASGTPPPLDQQPAFVTLGLARRADHQSATLRQRAALRESDAANQNQHPDVSISVDVGYAGLVEGARFGQHFRPLSEQRTGLNVLAGVSYAWPMPNNGAAGVYAQRRALRNQRDVQVEETGRQIATGVTNAFHSVRHSALEQQAAAEAVGLYRQAVDHEWQKFTLGVSTLLDVITLEDRWRGARLTDVNARLAHAVAVAQLRFETGTIPAAAELPSTGIQVRDVTTIPVPDRR